MRTAAEGVVGVMSELASKGTNVVSEVISPEAEFTEWEHYPGGDVHDLVNHSRYYYHSHDGSREEHGHFHLFSQMAGLPSGLKVAEGFDQSEWPSDDPDPVIHLYGIKMDPQGLPTHLFTVNRWVADEYFFASEHVVLLLDRFSIQDVGPSDLTNRWVSLMSILFRPQIEYLLFKRDEAIAQHRVKSGADGSQVLENRELEIPSICEISIVQQLDALGMLED